MKKALILLLALILTLALCACGEDEKETDATTATSGKPIETTVSTTTTETELPDTGTTNLEPSASATVEEPTDATTTVTKPATTTAIPTTVRTLETKPTTTTTKAPTTTTTKAPTTTAAEQPVDPSGVVQSVEYWGNDYRVDGTDLTFTALMFDGEYCVIIDRQFTSAPEVAMGTTIEYGGKTYYSVGGGMDPVMYTISGTEIVLSDGGKLALYRNGTVKVIASNSSLKKDMLFTVQPQ